MLIGTPYIRKIDTLPLLTNSILGYAGGILQYALNIRLETRIVLKAFFKNTIGTGIIRHGYIL